MITKAAMENPTELRGDVNIQQFISFEIGKNLFSVNKKILSVKAEMQEMQAFPSLAMEEFVSFNYP